MFKRALAWRTLRFAIVGALSLGAYYIVYITFTEFGLYYLISSVLAFFAYWSVNFTLHKKWTFRSIGDTGKQATQHFGMHLFNHGFNLVGLYLLVERIGVDYVAAQIMMSVVITVEVFILSHFIFKTKV